MKKDSTMEFCGIDIGDRFSRVFVIDADGERLREYDRMLEELAKEHYPETTSLQTVPGVGPITALVFRLVIQSPERFPDSRSVASYLGLVPRRDQSGERDPQLGISKAGDDYLKDLEKWRDLIHLEFANLKTGIQGTYHGRVERQHLQAYLNEFAFRHNRRFYDPGFGFLRTLRFGMQGRAPTWDDLYTTDEYGRSVHLSGVEAGGCGREPLQE